MPARAQEDRMYCVYARDGGPGGARVLSEASFAAAAAAFVEEPAPPARGEAGVSLIVRELASGRERRFRFDLESGRVSPD